LAGPEQDPLEALLEDAEAARVEAGALLSETGEAAQVIRFLCGGRSFALPIEWVERTERIPPITSVPRAPAFVRGLASLRGGVVCLVDLVRLLDLDPRGVERPNSLLLLGQPGRRVGVLSDSLPDFERIEPDELLRVTRSDVEVYRAALERESGLVGLLDPERVLALIERRMSDASL
jgi:purine-binding chemotaxis protein CheW